MFIEQPPWFFRALYPQAIFRMDPNERAVYLTFDDGPKAGVTDWLLDELEKRNVKVTFFLIGSQADLPEKAESGVSSVRLVLPEWRTEQLGR